MRSLGLSFILTLLLVFGFGVVDSFQPMRILPSFQVLSRQFVQSSSIWLSITWSSAQALIILSRVSWNSLLLITNNNYKQIRQMFIQLDLEEIFDADEGNPRPSPKLRSPLLSVVSEDEEDVHHIDVPHCELNSSLFKSSSADSAEPQSVNQTVQSTEPLHSHYEVPGQRLYYEGRHNMVKKLKEIERWKYEMTQQEKDVLTFAPQINKNTSKILSQRLENSEGMAKAKQRKQMRIKEYEQLQKQKSFEAAKQCTFKPQIAKKTQQLTKNRSEDVFTILYRESKMKQIRQKVKQQFTQPLRPANSQQAVESFLERNNQFIQKTKKKLTMLEQKSLHYDLNTGQKLFTPKTSSKLLKSQHSKSGAIFRKNQSLQNLNKKLVQKIKSSIKGQKGDQGQDLEAKQRFQTSNYNFESCFE